MWIKKSEYKELRKCKRMKEQLEKECKRLAEQITSQTENCKMGVWCKECEHRGLDWSEDGDYDCFGMWHRTDVCGKVEFCKKHIREICPEFEMKGE